MFSSMLSLLGSLKGATTSFISNSLRFRSSASAYLNKTPAVTGNRKTWTWSGWVKRGALSGTIQLIEAAGTAPGTETTRLYFGFNSTENFIIGYGGADWRVTTQLFRDISSWYHIVVAFDSGNATALDRIKLYVNGLQVTSFSTTNTVTLNTDGALNNNIQHFVGRDSALNQYYFDGYLTEVNFIDGQALTPASFGAIDSSTGVWSPRPYSGTYGTNGFRLRFNNTSSVAALGTDSSGNGNTWTVNNVSLTAGATYDSMLDVPVNYADGGNGRGNYAVLNPALTNAGGASLSISNGNLTILRNSAGYARGIATLGMLSEKWYFEFTPTNNTTSQFVGVGQISGDILNYPGFESTSWGFNTSNGNKTNNAINTAYGSYIGGQTIGVAVDMTAGKIWFSVNGLWQASGDPATGVNPAFTGLTGEVFPQVGLLNATTSAAANFGQRPFAYTPPAGFRALNTNNLPTPAIVNGANYMAATTYTGNATARSLSNAVNSVSFQPDLVWIKSRTPGATNHALFDSVRGTTKYLSSNTTTGETTNANTLTAFGVDGFSLGTDTTLVNANANSYIAWQWKESAIAGLDVVSYTGTGVARTVAHNLGVVPAMIIVKDTSTAVNWVVYQSSQGANKFLRLNTTDAVTTDATIWNNTSPTSSVFSVGGVAGVNTNGNNYVAYCFAEIAGFSRFGSYTGNGSTDGPFVFCGFRPRWVIIKRTDVANYWLMLDTSRDTFNQTVRRLFADLASAEDSGGDGIDFLSNGFKLRVGASAITNALGGTYIFAAFAETPSKYALAR